MPAPTSPFDLSTTANSNGPDGATEAVNVLDNYIRGLSASVKMLHVLGSDITAASTITPAATASVFGLAGTTTVTTIDSDASWDGRIIWFKHEATHQFTHSSGLILPNSVNHTFVSGDYSAWVQETTDTWRCIAIHRANQWGFSATNGSGDTPVIFATEEYDYGGVYNNSTGVFTAVVPGLYLVSAAIVSTAASAGTLDLQLVKNGSTTVRRARRYKSDSSNTDSVELNTVLLLAAGDTLECDNAGSLTVSGTQSTSNYFSVNYIGR